MKYLIVLLPSIICFSLAIIGAFICAFKADRKEREARYRLEEKQRIDEEKRQHKAERDHQKERDRIARQELKAAERADNAAAKKLNAHAASIQSASSLSSLLSNIDKAESALSSTDTTSAGLNTTRSAGILNNLVSDQATYISSFISREYQSIKTAALEPISLREFDQRLTRFFRQIDILENELPDEALRTVNLIKTELMEVSERE